MNHCVPTLLTVIMTMSYGSCIDSKGRVKKMWNFP